MSRIRSKDSRIEIEFRKKLWKVGLRYRKNAAKYFGKPDLVLSKYKTVIFIDSCFWHGCRTHKSTPQTRQTFWKRKINRNIQRDKEVNVYYKELNWITFRVWEHNLKNNPQRIVKKIINSLNKPGSTSVSQIRNSTATLSAAEQRTQKAN